MITGQQRSSWQATGWVFPKKNKQEKTFLFAKTQFVCSFCAELDEDNFTGRIVVQYQGAIRHLKGVPAGILYFGVSKPFEQIIATCPHQWNTQLTLKFFPYFYIIPLGIEIHIPVLVKYSATTL